MQRRSFRYSFAALVFAALMATSALAAPVYNHGQLGTFGHIEDFTWSSPHVEFNTLDDFYSARFTSMEQLELDRVTFRLSTSGPEVTMRIGLQADVGGNPSGTYLVSGTSTATGAASLITTTFSSFTLQPDTVYHVVIEPIDLGGGTARVWGSAFKQDIRPYDRASDPMMQGLQRLNGGAWGLESGVNGGRDPFFYFGNGSNVVGGPGQAITASLVPANNFLASTATVFGGQQFVITDKEVPAGAEIWMNQIRIATDDFNGPTNPLIIHVRDDAGNILGTASISPSEADGTFKILTLDRTVKLKQGQTYLLTTEFVGTGGQSYRFAADAVPSGVGDASWGGTTFAVPIVSSDGWATWNPRADRLHVDMLFSFQGQVWLPEPASAAVFVLALAAIGRRTPVARRVESGIARVSEMNV